LEIRRRVARSGVFGGDPVGAHTHMVIASVIAQFALLSAAIVVVVALTVVFARHAEAGAWALVAVFAAAEAIVPPLGLQATAGGLTVYAMDILVVIMFAIGLLRLVARPNPSRIRIALGGMAALVVLHALWGIASFGLEGGVNGSRSWLYFIGPLVFASQAVPRWARRSFTPLIIGAVALSAFALVSIGRYGLHGANVYIDVRGEFVDARPVMAKGALLIVQCLLLAMAVRLARPGVLWVAVVTMASAALLLQYRTIWVVALIVAVLAYTKWARVAIFVNRRGAVGAAGVVLLVAPVVAALTVSSSAFAESFHSATAQDSTFEWRWKSWTSLLAAHDSIQDRVVGVAAGTPLDRRIGNIVWDQSPHSLYVDALLSLGAVGLVGLVYLWFIILQRRRHAGAVLGITGSLVAVIVLSQVIFGFTNMLDPAQGLVLGILLQASLAMPENEASAIAARAGPGLEGAR
jgi:O-antigen ligase